VSKQGRIFVINDPTSLRIVPALAEEIGLNESIVLLQMEFWISISDHLIDGRRWTYQSIRDMKEKAFTFWSKDTINRAIKSLISQNLLIEGNFNTKKYDKTRWFALGDGIRNLQSIRFVEGFETRSTQNDTASQQYDTRSTQNATTIPETTTENTTKITTEDIYIVDRASETEEENFLEEEKPISKGKDAVPYKEIVSLYHELCPSLPRVAQLTDTRKRKLKVLWNFVEGNLDKIKEVFEKAEESEFLSGRNAKWTGCNFDWLINTNNFVKVLEGSYNDRRSTGETHRRDEDDPFGIKAYLSQWGDDLSMYER